VSRPQHELKRSVNQISNVWARRRKIGPTPFPESGPRIRPAARERKGGGRRTAAKRQQNLMPAPLRRETTESARPHLFGFRPCAVAVILEAVPCHRFWRHQTRMQRGGNLQQKSDGFSFLILFILRLVWRTMGARIPRYLVALSLQRNRPEFVQGAETGGSVSWHWAFAKR
jgi:hypothetical protein